ncbi:MAG: glutaredoxin family protein [Pirellulaceae bacterium]
MKRLVEFLSQSVFNAPRAAAEVGAESTANPKVIIYTRTGCHLCDDAIELVRQQQVQPILIDIDADPQLRERFNVCVPVVEIEGKIRFRGKVDPVLLRRTLRAERKRRK